MRAPRRRAGCHRLRRFFVFTILPFSPAPPTRRRGGSGERTEAFEFREGGDKGRRGRAALSERSPPFLQPSLDRAAVKALGLLQLSNSGEIEELPPPPPVPPNVEPLKTDEAKKLSKPKRALMARAGCGKKGQPIQLLTNHFKVNLKYEDDRPVDGKGIGRRVIDKLQQTYASELANKDFAYDGEKSLFTIGALPQRNNEFTVVLEDINTGKSAANGGSPGNDSPGNDKKRVRRPYQTKTFKVELNFAAKIPMNAIAQALRGQESENTQEAIRVIDIILRQHSAKQGCLLVRQSFFHNNPSNFVDLGGGVMGCRGFHSSFRATQSGLSLNIDVSTTMIVKPGPVIDFLLANQKVDHPNKIDWAKAKRSLKNLRIRTSPANTEYKIVGLSERNCNDQLFTLKQRNGDNGDHEGVEVTVYDYFVRNRGIELRYSGDYPCINVGKPKRPTYFPIELCSLVPLQRYTKALSTLQRSSLVEKSRQKPEERMNVLSDVLKRSNYDTEPMLNSCGISIARNFTQVAGRVLQPPKLKAGNGEDLFARNGRWNFNNKRLIKASSIEKWAVVNFSARCNIRDLVRDIVKCGGMKGIKVEDPFDVIEEDPSMRRAPAARRVDDMIDKMQKKLPGQPKFLLCVLAERKNSDIYGPWKRKCLAEFGIITQCVAPTRVNDQYITNVLLKINAKLGGLNSLLQIETSPCIPLVSKVPTIILGMDVSHGSPGQSDIPSIAAVVSSREWPLVSKYRASVCSQSPKLEMIDGLFKPKGTQDDDGLIRDGVSESQFTQVLNIELDQIIEACKFLDENWSPKFTLIVAQKNHHTKFFVPGSPNNVPPGTVVDNTVCHPRNNDFYMCAHAGMIGTTRPTHYHILHDEIGFSPDDLQELVHSLSYVYQRSTTAISVVAPICYAHLAAAQVSQFVKFDEMSETSSSHGGHTLAGSAPVPELPRLHNKGEPSAMAKPPLPQPPPPKEMLPMSRKGFGTKGQPTQLLTNHFRVSVRETHGHFYHYHVDVKYEDDKPVEVKGLCRRVVDKLQETYASDLANKEFAYDGVKSLFTVGALPTTARRSPGGDDGSPGASYKKRMKWPMSVKKFTVEISFAAEIPMKAIAQVLRGQETKDSMEALRVLDITLRQHSARHFRPTESGLSLNVDVSTTMIVRPGPVIDFLLFNQSINDPHRIDWGKAKRALKNMRIKTTHTNSEFRITGLSEDTCYQQTFEIKKKNGNSSSDTVEVATVFEYYMKHWKIGLKESSHFPCLNVGKPKRPTYIPLEVYQLCHLVPLQRYTKALSTLQRSSLVEKSRQKPQERMSVLSGALRDSNYNSVPMLRECGISIAQEFTQVPARVLQAPKLNAGDGREIFACNGRWNFNKNRLILADRVQRWAVVNFSSRCKIHQLLQDLIKCGGMKGLQFDNPGYVLEEKPHMRRERAATRVNDMFDQLSSRDKPSFVLCVLPERKNCDIYGPWKHMCLVVHGIFTQCVAPTKITDQYLTNVFLKINAKLGGLNSQLQIEIKRAIPLVSETPTIIFGMDVSHGSPGRDDVPSVAAVVSSLEWPLISKYRASVCTQSPRLEMIDLLFKLVENGNHQKDCGMIRDGVSEGQFNQVLNIELAQIIKACDFFADTEWFPKFTVIVAQKNHHTKFFQQTDPTILLMSLLGTTRPTHYHVLHDENNFSPDDLQELVHNLSYVSEEHDGHLNRCSDLLRAPGGGAGVADDAASEGSSGGGGGDGATPRPVPELPRLHRNVRQSMFFC
uniref:Piwi domain-containing protein n=1 Tax=Leersia perrieri TaxID=77586 RepID=A0A0D9UZK6_9ORYZ